MSESTLELAVTCELLGRLWLQEVDLSSLEAIRTEPFRDTYEELGGFVPSDTSESTIETLAVEYCELLIGPKGHISPVESVWAEEQLQSQTASSMHRFFELVPSFELQSSFPDHIGVQLEFASQLLRVDDESAHEILNHFVATHFSWMPKFLSKVTEQTNSEFYRGLANLTSGLIDALKTTSQQSD